MPSKPKDEKEVYDIMIEYCKQKKFDFTNKEVEFMAENCYLTFESKGWKGITYWPAIAKRWVLNNISMKRDAPFPSKRPVRGIKNIEGNNPPGKTVRDRILEQKNNT